MSPRYILQSDKFDYSVRWELGAKAYWHSKRLLFVPTETALYIGTVVKLPTALDGTLHIAVESASEKYNMGKELPWTPSLMSCHLDEELCLCIERWMKDQPLHVVREVLQQVFARAMTHLDGIEGRSAPDESVRYERDDVV